MITWSAYQCCVIIKQYYGQTRRHRQVQEILLRANWGTEVAKQLKARWYLLTRGHRERHDLLSEVKGRTLAENAFNAFLSGIRLYMPIPHFIIITETGSLKMPIYIIKIICCEVYNLASWAHGPLITYMHLCWNSQLQEKHVDIWFITRSLNKTETKLADQNCNLNSKTSTESAKIIFVSVTRHFSIPL